MKFLIICLVFVACSKQEINGELEIKKEVLKTRIATLSSDEFAGRAPATDGGQKAIDYIINQYKEIGLKPINGSFKQEVNLIGSKKNIENSFLRIRSETKSLSIGNDKEKNPNITYFSTSQKELVDIKNAEIVFVGYGVEAPEFGWDDFKGIDVKDKILLMLNNDPQLVKDGFLDPDYFKGITRTYYGRYTYKFEQAMKHGAAGAILIHTTQSAGYPFNILQGSGSEIHYAINVPNSGYQVDFLSHIDSLTSDRIAKKMGKTLPDLFEMALDKNFKPVRTGLYLTSQINTEMSQINTHNLFAKIEGSDPILKNQYILFSSHYDHEGIKPTDIEADDEIFNGAWDNASGSASILSIAEAFINMVPKRSILFFHCAAEESGLLGSEYFVAKPPVPLNQIVADINIDMPNIYGLSFDLAVIGVNSNSMGDDLKIFAKQVMVTENESLLVTDDPNPNAGLFYRSDQVHFAKAGIPSLFVGSGLKFIGKPDSFYSQKMATVYHKAADQIDSDWDLSGMERDLRLIFRTALKIANDKNQPKWHSGNEFENAFNELYKK